MSDRKPLARFGMVQRNFATLVVVVASVLVMPSAELLAQDYTAPKTAEGTPDLNGIWQALGTAHWSVEPHSAGRSVVRDLGALGARPGGGGVVEGDDIPYRPEALLQRQENFDNRLRRDPAIKCYLPGVPRATYMPFPFQIIQSQRHVMVLHEFAGAVRTIYMEDQIEAPADSWMGWSNGHWDGETLVVDTTGFNGMTWLDRSGNFHSPALHVVERFTARSPDTLWYEVTIEDPNVYTRPWKMSMPLYRRVEPDAQIMEFRCVEFVEDLIYGHLRKQPDR